MILKGKGGTGNVREREREMGMFVATGVIVSFPFYFWLWTNSQSWVELCGKGRDPSKVMANVSHLLKLVQFLSLFSVSYNYLSWPPPLYFWPLFPFGQFLNFRSALFLSLSLSLIFCFFISSLHPKLMYIYDMALGKKKCCDLAWIHKPFLPTTNSQNGSEQMFGLSLNCPCNSFRNCFYIF